MTAKLVWINGKNMYQRPVNCHANSELFINWFDAGEDEDVSLVSGYIVSMELHQWKRDEFHHCFHYDRVILGLEQPCGDIVEIMLEDKEADKLFYGLKHFAEKHGINDLELDGCLHYGDSPDSYKSWYDVF